MWFTPTPCGPGTPELSKSDSDMASKLFAFTFTLFLPKMSTFSLDWSPDACDLPHSTYCEATGTSWPWG